MATITSAATGLWSAGGTWVGGVAPTASDDATIANTHTVTLDTLTAVANSVTVSSGGTFAVSTTISSKLTLQLGFTAANGSTISGDLSTVPAITCSILMNASNNATAQGMALNASANFTLKGALKTTWTTTTGAISAGATSCAVTDATGWLTGDTLVLATTDVFANPPHVDTVTATVAGTAISWTGGTTYGHQSGCYVGNFTHNLTIGGYAAGYKSFVYIATQSGTPTQAIDSVTWSYLSGYTSFPNGPLQLQGAHTALTSMSNCAYYYASITSYQAAGAITRDMNVFYSPTLTAIYHTSTFDFTLPDTNSVVFYAATGLNINRPGVVNSGLKISGCTSNGIIVNATTPILSACDIWACGSAVLGQFGAWGGLDIRQSTIGTKFSASNTYGFNLSYPLQITATDQTIQASGQIQSITSAFSYGYVNFINKGADPSVQEIYTYQSSTVPAIQRNTTTASRSTSSVVLTCSAATPITQSFTVLAKSGIPIQIIGLMQKSGTPAYGASTLPSITISGLGITPVVATMNAATAADTWGTVTLSATQTSGSDGLLTVTFTAQSATAGAKAYFSGVPIPPFVSRCRHYGYTFDETSPTRTANITTSAAEATAAAYTGMSVTWGASLSTTAITASNTFQKLYDYTQAQGCLNVGSAMPLTGAGVAGNAALFLAGNLTVNTTAVLNGAGSISVGAYTLTTEFAGAVAYTYTGGTWSQLTTVPNFSGGTLYLGASGTYTFTMSSAILSMTPTAPSTYNLAGGTFSGTIDLRNTTANAITVQVPSGTATTTANNTGGVITVSAPQVYQSVTVNGLVAGSRIQIYDTTSSAELYNGAVTGTTYTWTDSVAAVSSRTIRRRVAYVSGVTAKKFKDELIGTCGITSGDASISNLVSPEDDPTYNTNAIDGSTITGMSIVDASFLLNITTASVTWPQIYAYQAYWLFTSAGIADEGNFITAPDTANYLLSLFKIKNTSSPSVPLTITGGYGRNATTGLVKDIIDTSGGNIYPMPDHAIPYSSGSGLTAGQAAQISAIESKTTGITYTAAGKIDANIIAVNSQTISGAGTTASPWKP